MPTKDGIIELLQTSATAAPHLALACRGECTRQSQNVWFDRASANGKQAGGRFANDATDAVCAINA